MYNQEENEVAVKTVASNKISKERGNTMENEKTSLNIRKLKKQVKGITLIALVVTILFSYDEKLKFSNSKGFLLTTI